MTLASGARAVFKAAAAREVEVELWALRSMSERGVRVPEVIAGAPDAQIPYLVTRLVPGEPGVATPKAASAVGRLPRAVHSLPVEGAAFFKEASARHHARVRRPGPDRSPGWRIGSALSPTPGS
ncbi:hypothetical protein [Nonomuraea sp. JJY05]|uniref:hypothetical protein n=1 Tax=Nonomuraea sp. JJY05 TaxID=3350255 RepID=UPI00373F51DF